MSHFYNPVDIYMEQKGLQQFVQNYAVEISELDRVLVLTRGDGVHELDSLSPLFAALNKPVTKLKELALSNPDLEDLFQIIQELKPFDYQFIIAIGGGSVLDVAKALSALKGIDIPTVAALREIIVDQDYVLNNEMPDWVGIPTTSGTGSEVTSWATIWDSELGKKYSITSELLYARASIILPELTLTLPLKMSVVTTLDALCHATEAYWAVYTNPVTRVYALEAIKRIRINLPKLETELQTYEVREQLALASLFAGLAFSNTRTTACHSISYPLTLLHNVEHGLAASLTLGSILKVNQFSILELERLLEAFGASDVQEVEEFIITMYEKYGLIYELSKYGLDEKGVEIVVNNAFTKGRIDNNPVALTQKDIESILIAKL